MHDESLTDRPLIGPRVRRLLRILLLSLSLAVGSTMILLWVLMQLKDGRYLGDYNVFWGIADAPMEYVYRRYRFAYPPTALLLIRPFGFLEFWWAYALWIGAGVLAMVTAARRMVGWDAILFGFISYAGIGVVVGGQTSLFVGALIVAGLTIARPQAAGILLGVAAAIKPQSLLAAPIALIASRNYRAIGWAAATGALLFAVTILLWGVDQWIDWLASIQHFSTYLRDHDLDQADKGIYGLALQLGLPG
ncbi:MAG: glycosyltransferase family 87 protein [Sphingomicrobium sp.]